MMTAWMLESALRSLVMAAVVYAGLKLVRIQNVAVQKTAWVLVLLASLAMPSMQHWHLPQSRAAVRVPMALVTQAAPPAIPQTTVDSKPAIAPTSSSTDTAITALPMPAEMAKSRTRAWQAVDWKRMIAPVYLAVCAFLLIRLFAGLAMAARILKRADNAWTLLDPRASVRVSQDIETPVTIGSTIVLPASHAAWDPHTLRVVLAHERAHVHQGDFYLQVLTGFYAAFFWFSPLSWWLRKEISDLAEALSDRAALKEAQSPTNYAEVLMEFASIRRRPLAGVAMARSGNLHRRVDRLLVEQKLQAAFHSKKWHFAAIALVPVALIASVMLVQVQSADAMKVPTPAFVLQAAPLTASAAATPLPAIAPASVRVSAQPSARLVPAAAAQTSAYSTQASSYSPGSGFSTGSAYSSAPTYAYGDSQGQSTSQSDSRIQISDKEEDSYALVGGDSSTISGSGTFGGAFERTKGKLHGSYIFFMRNGKSYVIDDPALVSQAHAYLKPIEELGRQQGELGRQQGELGRLQGELGRQQAQAATVPPDISRQLAEAQAALASLQKKNFQADVKQADLGNLQNRLAAIQLRLGDMQARFSDSQSRISEKQAALGEQQATLGEKQAKLGEQQAALGEQQSKLSREASGKIKSLIDNAMQSGKARPVN